MTIAPVTPSNFAQAAEVYALSWRESHRHICSPEFLARRDCAGYLRRGMEEGKRLFLLLCPEAAGIISLNGNEIGDLYIHPTLQGKGCGTALLAYALTQTAHPRLTVLSDNHRAIKLYERFGFLPTDRKHLREGLWEVTMERNND